MSETDKAQTLDIYETKRPVAYINREHNAQQQKVNKSRFYREHPNSLSIYQIYKHYALVHRFIVFKYALDTASPEEQCLLEAIRSDFKFFDSKTSFLAFIAKVGILTYSINFTSKLIIPLQFKAMVFIGIQYMLNMGFLKKIMSIPRLDTYLKIMQLGEDYELDRETKQIIAIVNNNGEVFDDTSKKIKLIVNTSISVLLFNHRDEITDNGYDESESY